MVMLLTDNIKIQEVLLFPAMKPVVEEEKKVESQPAECQKGAPSSKEEKVSTGASPAAGEVATGTIVPPHSDEAVPPKKPVLLD